MNNKFKKDDSVIVMAETDYAHPKNPSVNLLGYVGTVVDTRSIVANMVLVSFPGGLFSTKRSQLFAIPTKFLRHHQTDGFVKEVTDTEDTILNYTVNFEIDVNLSADGYNDSNFIDSIRDAEIICNLSSLQSNIEAMNGAVFIEAAVARDGCVLATYQKVNGNWKLKDI